MKTPWWRKSNQCWTVTLPNGKQKTLGKDPHGEGRKDPPKEIEKKWHEALAELANKPVEVKPPSIPSDLPLSVIRDKYLAYLEHPGTKEKTRSQWKQFLEHTGDMPVSELRVHHVTDYLKSKTKWSSTSKATALERINTAINWTIGQQLVDKAYRLEFPKAQKPRRTQRRIVLAPEVQAQLESEANPALRVILTALRLSGARPNELCTAMIERFDRKGRVLKVFNKTRHKTGVEYRDLYLTPELVTLIKGQIAGRKKGLIFRNNHGAAWKPREIAAQVRRRRRKLGLPDGTTPYAHRHTFASNAINKSNVNPAHVAKLLGHEDLTMLMRTYFKEDPEAMRKAVEEATK